MNVAAPPASSEAVRRSMRGNRSRDTAPELALRRAVHRLGLRYFACRRPLPALRRTADLVFPRARVAVFLDGCFWHGCPEHGRPPRSNTGFWDAKLARNRERDVETTATLAAAGWTVLRFWEHQDPGACAAEVERVVLAVRRAAA